MPKIIETSKIDIVLEGSTEPEDYHPQDICDAIEFAVNQALETGKSVTITQTVEIKCEE